MAAPKRGFINVDELVERIEPEEVLRYYGVAENLELHRSGGELRMRCVLNCGCECESGDRAVAMRTDDLAKRWKCHQYECGRSGNLVGFMDLLKDGAHMGGRPRGERFKAIARDLQDIAEGGTPAAASPAVEPADPIRTCDPEPVKFNVPLARHEKDAARKLVTLDEKFLREANEDMNRYAASYLRKRPWLTRELMSKWRMGYLPHDAGGDRSGGTMRGRVVYPMLSDRGELLTWFGRDPQYEEKRSRWESGGRDPGKEPHKFHFVKGFHRGLELFGQPSQRLTEPGYRKTIRDLGILVVEGPNDVIRLDALSVPAVGLCSNHVSREQVQKLTRWAHQLAGGRVTLMLDCDPEGEQGAKQSLYEIAQYCDARLAWSATMFDGRFRNRQPESLTMDEWRSIRQELSNGGRS